MEIGARVQLVGAYLDEAQTQPVTGTIEDVITRTDWGGMTAYVVMFDHGKPGLPPGGEFPARSLRPLQEAN